MDEKRKHGRIAFNCYFTSTIRRLFRQKREMLGLPYQSLAEFFGVNWSTIRKWEMGPTKVSEIVYRPLIEGFINGDFDHTLKLKTAMPKEEEEFYELPASSPMHQCMERATTAYHLCQHDEEISENLLSEIETASRRAISRLVTREFKDFFPLDRRSPNSLPLRDDDHPEVDED